MCEIRILGLSAGARALPPRVDIVDRGSLFVSVTLLHFHITTLLTADTLVRAWEKHEIWDNPPTRGIELQKTASPARGASTKRETQYQAARTLSRVELKPCSYQILWQRRLLFQPQHHSRRPTLGDLLRRGRDSSNRNAFVVLNVLQIQEPQRSHGSQLHVAHGSEAWWPAAHS